MSRLDSMLRRLAAQRDGLNWAAEQTAGLEGDVVDFGLGNGRTYNNEYHFLIEIRDGKIAAVREYLDTMHTADVLKG